MADMSGCVAAIRADALRIHSAAVRRTLFETRLRCPIRTGALSRSVKTTPSQARGDMIVATIGSPLDYAAATDTGSKPHRIVARRARALRFFWERGPRGPGVYFYRSVHHPGTKGTGWFTKEMPTRWLHALQTEGR